MSTESKKFAVIGSGIMGRMIGFFLALENHSVDIFEQEKDSSTSNCSSAAGGMLCPYSELESFDQSLLEISLKSLELWKILHKEFFSNCYFNFKGTLVVSLEKDQSLQNHYTHKLDQYGLANKYQILDKSQFENSNSSLIDRIDRAVYLPSEGVLDNIQIQKELEKNSKKLGVNYHFEQEVLKVEPNTLYTQKNKHSFDHIVDTRGIQANNSLRTLRGVRGEAILVESKDIQIDRCIRVIHPRYPIYIIPRKQNRYIIGATMIENHLDHQITVRSVLELLSAGYSLTKDFSEAKIIETRVGVRAAFLDNKPNILVSDSITYINGLFRHGFLLAPILAKLYIDKIQSKNPSKILEKFSHIIEEVKSADLPEWR